MLVLTRKAGDSVDILNEIKVTVEEITDLDGRPIRGGAVQLGFESPRHVTIVRSELDFKKGNGSSGKRRKRTQHSGSTVKVPNATVLLSIDLPQQVPVKWHGQAALHVVQAGGEIDSDRTVWRLVCHCNDLINICHNIDILIVDLKRFQFASTDQGQNAASRIG